MEESHVTCYMFTVSLYTSSFGAEPAPPPVGQHLLLLYACCYTHVTCVASGELSVLVPAHDTDRVHHIVHDRVVRIVRSAPCGWDPSAQSGGSKSEQVKQCMDPEHCLHWLHLEPTHHVLPPTDRSALALKRLIRSGTATPCGADPTDI
jgi:hypothetical protein